MRPRRPVELEAAQGVERRRKKGSLRKQSVELAANS